MQRTVGWKDIAKESKKIYNGKEKNVGFISDTVGELEKSVRNELFRRLKSKYSIRQIERVTGISRGVIHKS